MVVNDEIIDSGNRFTVNKKASRDVAGCKAVYACSDVVYVCFSFNS